MIRKVHKGKGFLNFISRPSNKGYLFYPYIKRPYVRPEKPMTKFKLEMERIKTRLKYSLPSKSVLSEQKTSKNQQRSLKMRQQWKAQQERAKLNLPAKHMRYRHATTNNQNS